MTTTGRHGNESMICPAQMASPVSMAAPLSADMGCRMRNSHTGTKLTPTTRTEILAPPCSSQKEHQPLWQDFFFKKLGRSQQQFDAESTLSDPAIHCDHLAFGAVAFTPRRVAAANMPPKKRTAADSEVPAAKRRSTRVSTGRSAAAEPVEAPPPPKAKAASRARGSAAATVPTEAPAAKKTPNAKPRSKAEPKAKSVKDAAAKKIDADGAATSSDSKKQPANKDAKKAKAPARSAASSTGQTASRAISEDPDVDSIPERNPEVVRHDGEWYWLLKAEPEPRFENGIDVSFSIDDLRSKKQPEPWDGIRAYPGKTKPPTIVL